jgi:hypothetical protein
MLCYVTALLAAAAPDQAPFMADECLMAIPEIEGIDYTTKEYLKFVQHIQSTVERLNKESKFLTASSFSTHLYVFSAVRSVHFGMKLYNDQRNAHVFNIFIYLLLPYMFRDFF